MAKGDLDSFDPSATFPDGVSVSKIRAEILSGSDAPCAPLPPPEPAKRSWNAEDGVWEVNGIPVPPDPSRASGEFDEIAEEILTGRPSLAGELEPIGTPVPPPPPPPPPPARQALPAWAIVGIAFGIGLVMFTAALLGLVAIGLT